MGEHQGVSIDKKAEYSNGLGLCSYSALPYLVTAAKLLGILRRNSLDFFYEFEHLQNLLCFLRLKRIQELLDWALSRFRGVENDVPRHKQS